MSTFELIAPRGPAPEKFLTPGGLDAAVLVNNAKWFIKIRWLIVGVFVFTGALGNLIPATIEDFGFAPPPMKWPWLLAGALAAANVCFAALTRKLNADSPLRLAQGNIYLQIIVDLAVVTLLVHIVGSTTTFIAFIYLFHIVLACIFFSRKKSLLVTLLAASGYLLCVTLEMSGVWPAAGMLLPAGSQRAPVTLNTTLAASAVFIWLVVWYLVSHLAETLRRRDQQLISANQALLRADEEKNLQVLRVTHDLKAPFVGMESNIQILRSSYWDNIPEEVRQIICKIEARGATLRARIGGILILGNLKSSAGATPALDHVQLRALLNSVIQDVQGLASQRRVSVALAAAEGTVWSDPKQLKILFLNLIANAVAYSHAGGKVEVEIEAEKPVRIRVADHGIGISEKALPHIFEDYYRANEAAQFNSQGTGLGLAIVRQVAQNLGLTVTVNSKQGEGAAFVVAIPEERRIPRGTNQDY